MPDRLMSRNLIRCVSVCALTFALSACADAGASDPREGDVTEELGLQVQAAPGAKLLARTKLSAKHRVEFWQGANDSISLFEGYAPDSGEHSALDGFQGGSFAAVYEKLAGNNVDARVLAHLRGVDARPRHRRAGEPSVTAPEETTDSAGDARSITKSTSEDTEWFLEQVCEPMTERLKPDIPICATETLEPGDNEQLRYVHDADVFVGSLFNAAFEGTATMVVTPENPRRSKTVTANPRMVMNFVTTDADALAIHSKGESFAVYYAFGE